MQSRFIYILIFTLGTLALTGQSETFRKPTFTISFFNHSIGVPFKDFVKTPLNIGFTAGVEFDYSNNGQGKNFQKFEVGWFHHKNLSTGIWLKTDYIRRVANKKGLFADFQGGLGYLRDYSVNRNFTISQDGQYQSKKNASRGGLLIGLGLGSGYKVKLNDQYSIAPFFKYEGMIQTPYAEIIPFLPHSMFHLGTKFNMNK